MRKQSIKKPTTTIKIQRNQQQNYFQFVPSFQIREVL